MGLLVLGKSWMVGGFVVLLVDDDEFVWCFGELDEVKEKEGL